MQPDKQSILYVHKAPVNSAQLLLVKTFFFLSVFFFFILHDKYTVIIMTFAYDQYPVSQAALLAGGKEAACFIKV